MKQLFTSILLLVAFFVSSQKNELGNVTIDELKEKVCPADTSAVAAVLFNIGKTSFEYNHDRGFEIVTVITTKIKVYKKEGYNYANHALDYFVGGGNGTEKVDISKAVTYNLVNNKIEKSKLTNDGEFTEKVNKDWLRKKITMPNVKVGSVIEYKTEIRSPFIWDFPDWEFQKDIPVNYSEYTTYIPEYFIYNTHYKGFIIPLATPDEKSRKIEYTYKTEMMPGMNAGSGSERVNSSLDFKESIVKYSLSNVPALKKELYVNNLDNYRATILHELAGTRYPNSPYKNFTTDWASVTKKVYESESFGNELKKTGYFEKDIDVLLKDVTSQDEKIGTIFNYIKSRMNWNEDYGIYTDVGTKKAYQEKKGNVAEINLMLTAMLRYAGFDANPVLISTRAHGISMFPSQSAFNYVISGLELGNQVVLLDATNKYAIPNILPFRDLNWIGRIIRKEGSSAQIDLMPKSNSKEIINVISTINPNGEVGGKIRDQYFDYNAFEFRETNNSIAKDSYIEKLEKHYQGLEIGEYEVQNSNDLGKPIIENYSFTHTNAVEIIGDKMYFSPFLFFAMTENPFKQETREYPVDFSYPKQEKYNVSITLPEGYVVETLPKPIAIGMPDELGNFKYNISDNGSQVQLVFSLDINQAIINSDDYEVLKTFFKEIVNKQTEKIVLKKV
jgi:transglutaminase-like putative cysteine protease